MDKLRVLHFADLVNGHDFIDNIVRNTDPAMFDMAVCTMGRASNIEEPDYAEAGIARWDIPAPTRSHYPRAVVRLAALLRHQDIDIIHAHHYEPCLIAAAATVAHPRTKLVVGRHYADAIYLHTAGWRRRAMLGLERAVNTRARLVIAPSQRIATLLDRQGVPPGKVAIIPYAFDPARFDHVLARSAGTKRSALDTDGRFTIGTFGRLYADKGHRFVLEALPTILKSVPNLSYVIVGEGAERPQLERQVRALDLERVVSFLGWRHDVAELMKAVDVVVQPSLQEAFSQSMAEALFLARPLVITDVSGANELIPHDSMGVVVPCRDAAALGRALIALEGDPHRRGAMAEAGRRHACATLSINTVVPLYEAAYRATAESARTDLRRSRAQCGG